VRVLVVGLYPPPGSPAAARTMHVVRHLETEGGHTVQVYSADCSAAHFRGALAGPKGAFQVLRRARRYDAVVTIGDGLLRSSPRWGPLVARLALLADCLAWGIAFRLMPHPEVAVENADVLPSGIGGRATAFMWQRVERVVFPPVPALARRIAPVANASTPVTTVAVSDEPVSRWDEGWDDVSEQAGLEELVQRRAAAARGVATR
jgi:hypothetical protein